MKGKQKIGVKIVDHHGRTEKAHGVFNAKENLFALLDEAWSIKKKDNRIHLLLGIHE